MTRTPLHIFIGPNEEVVLYENEIIAGLTTFVLDADAHIKTDYTVVNCFPRPSGRRVQPIEAKAYPLHIYVGDDINEMHTSLYGRPIGGIRKALVKLSTTQKRIVRLTSCVSLPKQLEVALLDLGVEIIVEPPVLKTTTGDSDAHV